MTKKVPGGAFLMPNLLCLYFSQILRKNLAFNLRNVCRLHLIKAANARLTSDVGLYVERSLIGQILSGLAYLVDSQECCNLLGPLLQRYAMQINGLFTIALDVRGCHQILKRFGAMTYGTAGRGAESSCEHRCQTLSPCI